MKALLIFSLLLFASCSHSLTLNPKGCYATGMVIPHVDDYKSFETTIISFGDDNSRELQSIFRNKEIDCKKVKNVNYTFKSGPIDSLISILPFVEMKTITINYTEN
ncbi:putative exported protein [Halobacteriovorax marinus SJ]|uniref:Exported protein n=1 Tax=Halobacteriovorax marinus (strain ATCC BAA-682 / DSM 15412 / SJ) TaxID=862908 RepID=E1X2N4_HALMS|nr:hypothetical protein [Halobacteriovorax marinus]CBW26802.1 putative exported protein [Halobacteriovorax marinus SJ]